MANQMKSGQTTYYPVPLLSVDWHQYALPAYGWDLDLRLTRRHASYATLSVAKKSCRSCDENDQRYVWADAWWCIDWCLMIMRNDEKYQRLEQHMKEERPRKTWQGAENRAEDDRLDPWIFIASWCVQSPLHCCNSLLTDFLAFGKNWWLYPMSLDLNIQCPFHCCNSLLTDVSGFWKKKLMALLVEWVREYGRTHNWCWIEIE